MRKDVAQAVDEIVNVQIGAGRIIRADRVKHHPSIATGPPDILYPRSGAPGFKLKL